MILLFLKTWEWIIYHHPGLCETLNGWSAVPGGHVPDTNRLLCTSDIWKFLSTCSFWIVCVPDRDHDVLKWTWRPHPMSVYLYILSTLSKKYYNNVINYQNNPREWPELQEKAKQRNHKTMQMQTPLIKSLLCLIFSHMGQVSSPVQMGTEVQ